MIYIFYGKNSFLIKRKIGALRAEFMKSHPARAIFAFSEDNFNFADFDIAIRSQALFETERLIIASNLLQKKEVRSLIISSLNNLMKNNNTITLIFEENDDLTNEVLNKIKPYANTVEHCYAPTRAQMKTWIKKLAKEKNIELASDEIEYILDEAKNNMWRIENILEAYTLGAEIRKETDFVQPNLFHVIDACIGKNHQRAFFLYHQAMLAGANSEDILWKLFWQFKTMSLVLRYKNESKEIIRKKTGLHPFVIQKTLSSLQRFSKEDIDRIILWIAEMWQESKIKIRAFEPELEFFLLTGKPLISQTLPERIG